MKQYLYIAFGCFVIATWALFVLLSGCAPSFNPQPDCLQVIKNRPYISGEYTCLDKSRDTCQCLIGNGYDAYVIHGLVRGIARLHAWNEIQDGEKTYWLDPTWEWGCWEKSKWTDRSAILRYKWTGKIKQAN